MKTINSTTDRDQIYTLYPFDKKVFFVANDGTHGFEPWASDGTVGGTRLVKDIAAGAPSSAPEFITLAGELMFFSADDEIHGHELWVSDGSGPGTYMVVDTVPAGGGGPDYCPLGGSCPAELTVSGSRLYYLAEENDGDVELWAYHLD